MSKIIELTEYGIEVILPEDLELTEEFYDLLPMGAITNFCDTCFTCFGFEMESDAQEALDDIQKFIENVEESKGGDL